MPDRRTLLAAALAYSGGTHTPDDVEAMAARNECQIWDGPNSVVVTQIEHSPQAKICHVFLCAGNRDEILAMHSALERWAKEQGCTLARFVGRKGWERVLREQGWNSTGLIIMEKSINDR